jgi:hypothetical protein
VQPLIPRSTAPHSRKPVFLRSPGGCRLIPFASERPASLHRLLIGTVGWRLHHPPAQTPANGVGLISHRLLAKHSPFSASRSLRQAVVGSAPNNESFAPCHQELATKIEALRTSTFPKSRLACRAEIPPGFARHDFCTLLLPDSCSTARKPGKGPVSGCCSQPQNNWPESPGPLHRALVWRQ